MTLSTSENAKQLLNEYREALYNFDPAKLKAFIKNHFLEDALLQFMHPFETLDNNNALLNSIYLPLAQAIPDLERRDTIVMSGESEQSVWIGCCGYYTGSFEKPWLGIPPTGHQVAMRFHEFYRFVDNKVVEVQSVWDIPELMLQAGVWPMAPALGREWQVPGPATQDGLNIQTIHPSHSQESYDLVLDMCNDLGNYASDGVAAMNLEKRWHPKMSWYGPSGIGTGRGINGFRNWHQIPFLNGMPNRVGNATEGHIFAEGDYVGFTAWPGMFMTISDDGWLGIPPSDKKISMRSLDFWRCENGLIRENWVMIDLLHVYHQLGVDVLKRMQERVKSVEYR
jgi:predicted ester cyclase